MELLNKLQKFEHFLHHSHCIAITMPRFGLRKIKKAPSPFSIKKKDGINDFILFYIHRPLRYYVKRDHTRMTCIIGTYSMNQLGLKDNYEDFKYEYLYFLYILKSVFQYEGQNELFKHIETGNTSRLIYEWCRKLPTEKRRIRILVTLYRWLAFNPCRFKDEKLIEMYKGLKKMSQGLNLWKIKRVEPYICMIHCIFSNNMIGAQAMIHLYGNSYHPQTVRKIHQCLLDAGYVLQPLPCCVSTLTDLSFRLMDEPKVVSRRDNFTFDITWFVNTWKHQKVIDHYFVWTFELVVYSLNYLTLNVVNFVKEIYTETIDKISKLLSHRPLTKSEYDILGAAVMKFLDRINFDTIVKDAEKVTVDTSLYHFLQKIWKFSSNHHSIGFREDISNRLLSLMRRGKECKCQISCNCFATISFNCDDMYNTDGSQYMKQWRLIFYAMKQRLIPVNDRMHLLRTLLLDQVKLRRVRKYIKTMILSLPDDILCTSYKDYLSSIHDYSSIELQIYAILRHRLIKTTQFLEILGSNNFTTIANVKLVEILRDQLQHHSPMLGSLMIHYKQSYIYYDSEYKKNCLIYKLLKKYANGTSMLENFQRLFINDRHFRFHSDSERLLLRLKIYRRDWIVLGSDFIKSILFKNMDDTAWKYIQTWAYEYTTLMKSSQNPQQSLNFIVSQRLLDNEFMSSIYHPLKSIIKSWSTKEVQEFIAHDRAEGSYV